MSITYYVPVLEAKGTGAIQAGELMSQVDRCNGSTPHILRFKTPSGNATALKACRLILDARFVRPVTIMKQCIERDRNIA